MPVIYRILAAGVGLLACSDEASNNSALGDPRCTPDPCANGGTCTIANEQTACACAPGFGGATCERPGAIAVAMNKYHACAILAAGELKCWGDNSDGQLGQGDTAPRGTRPAEMGAYLPAIDLGGGLTVRTVSAGGNFVCAIVHSGQVKCWGKNYYGQLGVGSASDHGQQANTMGASLPFVNLGTSRTATAIATGSRHACALLDNGTVKCWGDNSTGRLGLGNKTSRGSTEASMGDALPAVRLGSGRLAIGLAAGSLHTCALLDTGAVKCWGDNSAGELGLGDTFVRGDSYGDMGMYLATVDLGSGRTAKEIVAGDYHTCAMLDDGTAKCWGVNSDGRLGIGDAENRGDHRNEMGNNLPPIALGTGRTAKALSAGARHTCALLDDGTVKCWGDNSHGQLGQGDRTNRGDTPGSMGDALAAVQLGTRRYARAIATGSTSTCALLDDYTVKCWGDNSHGQLGQGHLDTRGNQADEMGDYLRTTALY